MSPTQEAVLAALGFTWTQYDSADQRTIDALVRRGLAEQDPTTYRARRAICRCVYPNKCSCPPEAKANQERQSK